MKARILAVLLSVAVTVSAIPTMNVSANPATFSEEESVVEEITEDIVEETVDEETITVEENVTEETVAEEPVVEGTDVVEDAVDEVVTEENVTEETVDWEEPETEETIAEETSVEETTEEETTEVECETVGEMADMEVLPIKDETSEIKALGSNGIAYDDVVYLSVKTVNALPKDAQSAYYELCDSIADLYESGVGISDVVIAVDKEKLMVNCSISLEELYTQDRQDSIISENVELIESLATKEEIIEGVEDADYVERNTLMVDGDYFRNQLCNNAKKVYDAGKKAIVQKGSNRFSVTWKRRFLLDEEHLNGLSALLNAYPNKFNWVNRGNKWSLDYESDYYYFLRKTEVTFTIEKSKYYSASLEKKADNKVKEIVDAAYAYAETKYPNSPTYGVIKYLNDWIVKNNYYENKGVNRTRNGNTEEYYYCHSCYGVLLKGYGVCESYALAMTRLLDAAGIRNQYVVGDAGGGHAWNHVQMPDGEWYMLDSTWNDGLANMFFLSGSGSEHKPDGKSYGRGQIFYFEPLSNDYYPTGKAETITINKSESVLKSRKTVKLKVDSKSNPGCYDRMKQTWSSSNTAVATVDKNGKVTAKGTGKAVITCKIAGKATTSTVYVYEFTGLTFSDSDSARGSNTWSYANETADFSGASEKTFTINVGQENRVLSALQLKTKLGLGAPRVSVDNKAVIGVTGISLSGDTITLKVKPKAIGRARILVSFAGQKAFLRVTTTQAIQESWFNYSKIADTVYTGRAITPKVGKTAQAPKNVTYKVTYENNKNAGTATVVIKGTGKYGGEFRKTFKIAQRDITNASFSCGASKVYNGKAQKANVTIKLGKTTLKAGIDYDVYYKNKLTVPIDAGAYTVKIKGKGNYKGTIVRTKTYVIKPISISKVNFSCPSIVQYTGDPVTPNYKFKIGSNVVPASDYEVSYIYKDGTESKTAPIEKGKHTLVITPKGKNIQTTATKKRIKVNYTIKGSTRRVRFVLSSSQ